MLFPIRCMTCSKLLNSKYKKYQELTKNNDPKVFEKLNIKRYCCKRIFLSEINLYDKIAK